LLLIGYFEGIDSQRGIAWRGGLVGPSGVSWFVLPEAPPDHSTTWRTRVWLISRRMTPSSHGADPSERTPSFSDVYGQIGIPGERAHAAAVGQRRRSQRTMDAM